MRARPGPEEPPSANLPVDQLEPFDVLEVLVVGQERQPMLKTERRDLEIVEKVNLPPARHRSREWELDANAGIVVCGGVIR